MAIRDALFEAKIKLDTAGIPSPWLDAELLLAHLLRQPRTYLTIYQNQPLNHVTIQQFNHLVMRRARGEPFAYLTGEKEFCGLSFAVNKHVLIPRSATEELVEAVIKEQRTTIREQGTVIRKSCTLIDVGTGSGCIAVTLALQLPSAHIIATDIAVQALAVARENAARHGVTDRIVFLQGDLLAPVLKTQTDRLIDCQTVLVAKLPYVPA